MTTIMNSLYNLELRLFLALATLVFNELINGLLFGGNINTNTSNTNNDVHFVIEASR